MIGRNSILAASAMTACAFAAPAYAGQADVDCAVKTVGVFENRVHVECVNMGGALGFGNIAGGQSHAKIATPYFAVPISSPMAAQVIALGSAALNGHSRRVHIFYDDNPARNPPGCNMADCRLLLGLEAE